ncbi:hypothetical protein cypCar_00003101 [Cyprinus carpio]|nr:hypothetical protein cypCar_00003101 [Cyprinus carpio]
MKQSNRALELIDLSFLSAEEEAAIRQVLLRDEDLKRLESGRVRKLRQSVPDFQQLKTLTGEWFEELRIKRYGQQTDVTAVVRSSMRWKKTAAKPTREDVAGRGQGSSKMKDEEDNAETEQRMRSNIVLSVLARAQKARPPILQKITPLEPKQETRNDTVPTTNLMASESPDPTEMEGQKHGVSDLEALLEGSTSKTHSYTADAWEATYCTVHPGNDEGVDSDDDDSLSSYGSNLLQKRIFG